MTPAELYGPEVHDEPDARVCECCGADLGGYGHPRGRDLLCAICYGSTFLCAGCGENIALADLNESPDGAWYCEDCGHDRSYPCERCGERFWYEPPTEIDGCSYCEDCADALDACQSCQGTGIGYPVDNDCSCCGGTGLRRRDRDWGDRADEAYERARDRRLEGDR
jgi:hypothetical protein